MYVEIFFLFIPDITKCFIFVTGHQTKILFATKYNIREYGLDDGSVKTVANIRYTTSMDYDNNGFVYCLIGQDIKV